MGRSLNQGRLLSRQGLVHQRYGEPYRDDRAVRRPAVPPLYYPAHLVVLLDFYPGGFDHNREQCQLELFGNQRIAVQEAVVAEYRIVAKFSRRNSVPYVLLPHAVEPESA